jgi:hypothetical protein
MDRKERPRKKDRRQVDDDDREQLLKLNHRQLLEQARAEQEKFAEIRMRARKQAVKNSLKIKLRQLTQLIITLF